MVVATPCPLILAAPIAFVAGLSRAARAGIIVKGAGALERLGGARTVLLDKTGTLTLGQPELERIVPLGGLEPDAGAAARRVARPDVDPRPRREPRRRRRGGAASSSPFRPASGRTPGRGIVGDVDGHRVAVGSSGWLEANGYLGAREQSRAHDSGDGAGRAKILVGVDGALAAVIVMGDRLRPGADTLARELRAGRRSTHVALVTGDRPEIAAEVARSAGIDQVYADQTPEGKLDVVRTIRDRPGARERRHGRRRHQRRARPRARRRRHRDGRQGRDDLVRDGRRRDHGRRRRAGSRSRS